MAASRPEDQSGADRNLAEGRRALTAGDWRAAVAAAETALARHESPEGRLLLAVALWCGYRVAAALDQLKRAYRLFRESGQVARAAWVAAWVACEEAATRGNPSVAQGWFRRAARLLDGVEPCAEHGWLLVWQAAFEGDAERLAEVAAIAAEIGRRFGDADLEILCHAQRGLALVSSGQVHEGMALLDEAMAAVTAGEATEQVVIGDCFCAVLWACEQTRDYGRAEEWCRVALEVAESQSIAFLKANCLASYGWILGMLGRWQEGERRLREAVRMFDSGHKQLLPDAMVKLADLRRRQGRTAEARRLLREVPRSRPRLRLEAELALDAGDASAALVLARELATQARPGQMAEEATALQLLARAAAGAGELGEAAGAVEALERVTSAVATPAMVGSLWLARAALMVARGLPADAAAAHQEAATHFARAGATFDEGRARLWQAQSLRLAGRVDEAEAAARDARRSSGADRAGGPVPAITSRELEVLRLLATGLSNAGIAGELRLSPHTVHRHVASLLRKLDVPTRAAAAAEATRLGVV